MVPESWARHQLNIRWQCHSEHAALNLSIRVLAGERALLGVKSRKLSGRSPPLA